MQKQNATIEQVHGMLVARMSDLSAALGKTTDPVKGDQIWLEMQEVMHRVNVSQNLLFAASSKELHGFLPGIQAANTALKESISQIGEVSKIINGTTQFLSVVDQALDLAKALIVA